MPPSRSFSTKLLKWYSQRKRDLPWRRTLDPYLIWISEVMLQQTTVNAVIPFYLKWIKTYPNINRLAKAPIQKVLKNWQGLGYYQRARNLHRSAKIIVEKFGGCVPSSAEVLKTLPGFGPYTVGAVLSIAFDQRQPIVDANIRRVMMRQLAMSKEALPGYDKKIIDHLLCIMPVRGNRIFNQALMELGALVCRSREPLCNVCPVFNSCRAYKKGHQEIIPMVKKKVISDINVAVAVIKKNNKFFIQKRPEKGLFAGLWEFPGGKVEDGEEPREAVVRELKEELGVCASSTKLLFTLRQYYTQFRAQLFVFQCEIREPLKIKFNQKWIFKKDFRKYPMPSGSARIVDKLNL